MELGHYWDIIRRRWYWVVIPAAIVLVLGVLTWDPPPQGYNTGARFITSQIPATGAADSDEQRYYNWLTSEYIVNGLADWVRGGRFAEDVSDYLLAEEGVDVPPAAIQGAIVSDNARSMLTVSLSSGDPDLLAVMMDGVIEVLINDNADALPQLGGNPAELVQLDEPTVNPVPAGIRSQLDLPLRVALALAVGFGLALLAEYLDPTVRQRTDLESLGYEILAEIPRK